MDKKNLSNKARKKRVDASLSKAEILAKGVATGITVTAITHAGRGIFGVIYRQPLAMFALGIASGWLINRYRKEIIFVAHRTGEHGKEFVLRQKESLHDLVAEAEEYAHEKEQSSQ